MFIPCKYLSIFIPHTKQSIHHNHCFPPEQVSIRKLWKKNSQLLPLFILLESNISTLLKWRMTKGHQGQRNPTRWIHVKKKKEHHSADDYNDFKLQDPRRTMVECYWLWCAESLSLSHRPFNNLSFLAKEDCTLQ